jgi:hypothetical protein
MERSFDSTALLIVSTCIASLAIVGGADAQAASSVNQKAIYGEDDRMEVYEVEPGVIKQRAEKSVAGMIRTGRLIEEDGQIFIPSQSLGQAQDLCEDEPFVNQPSIAKCSGTLIADDLILTAGHCVQNDRDCSNYSWVFNAYYEAEGERALIEPDDVFACEEIVDSTLYLDSEVSHDFAVVKLAREATPEFEIAPLRHERTALESEIQAIMIGFGAGIPMKIDQGGAVDAVRAETLDFFTTNSDAFGGNSGSAVFDSNGTIIGILVAGGSDYIYDEEAGCYRIARLPESNPIEQSSYVFRAVDALCNTTSRNDYTLCANRCGNGFCELTETEMNCAEDCGGDAPRCGNGACEDGEAVWNCKFDCELTIPEGWDCEAPVFSDGEICNCECGVPDPDCGDPNAPVVGCDDLEGPNIVCTDATGTCAERSKVCGNDTCDTGETEENCAVDCALNSSSGDSGGCSSTSTPTQPLAAALFIACCLALRPRRALPKS